MIHVWVLPCLSSCLRHHLAWGRCYGHWHGSIVIGAVDCAYIWPDLNFIVLDHECGPQCLLRNLSDKLLNGRISTVLVCLHSLVSWWLNFFTTVEYCFSHVSLSRHLPWCLPFADDVSADSHWFELLLRRTLPVRPPWQAWSLAVATNQEWLSVWVVESAGLLVSLTPAKTDEYSFMFLLSLVVLGPVQATCVALLTHKSFKHAIVVLLDPLHRSLPHSIVQTLWSLVFASTWDGRILAAVQLSGCSLKGSWHVCCFWWLSACLMFTGNRVKESWSHWLHWFIT